MILLKSSYIIGFDLIFSQNGWFTFQKWYDKFFFRKFIRFPDFSWFFLKFPDFSRFFLIYFRSHFLFKSFHNQLHQSLLCSRSRTQCFKSCFIYFSGKHSQSFRWSQNGGHSRSSGTLFKTRMEPPISHDEGIWLCLWQFYPRPSIWPAPLAIHLGLQNPAQVYRAQEMSFKIISGHLGK